MQDPDMGDRSISYTIPGKQVAQSTPKRASGRLKPACPRPVLTTGSERAPAHLAKDHPLKQHGLPGGHLVE